MHFSPFERAERTDLKSLILEQLMLPIECCTRRRTDRFSTDGLEVGSCELRVASC